MEIIDPKSKKNLLLIKKSKEGLLSHSLLFLLSVPVLIEGWDWLYQSPVRIEWSNGPCTKTVTCCNE